MHVADDELEINPLLFIFKNGTSDSISRPEYRPPTCTAELAHPDITPPPLPLPRVAYCCNRLNNVFPIARVFFAFQSLCRPWRTSAGAPSAMPTTLVPVCLSSSLTNASDAARRSCRHHHATHPPLRSPSHQNQHSIASRRLYQP